MVNSFSNYYVNAHQNYIDNLDTNYNSFYSDCFYFALHLSQGNFMETVSFAKYFSV